MSDNKQVKKTNEKKKALRKSSVTLLIGIFLLLIPLLVFGGVLLTAYVTNFKPVIGSRFAGDLNPRISETQLTNIETKVKALSNIEDCEVVLTTSQVRVNADTIDSLDKESFEGLIREIYGIVNQEAGIYTYFSASAEKKMYDLSIDLYNNIDYEDNFIHLNLTKNSQMAEPKLQLISEPRDEEIAKEVRGEATHEETPGGLNVDVEPSDDTSNEE